MAARVTASRGERRMLEVKGRRLLRRVNENRREVKGCMVGFAIEV